MTAAQSRALCELMPQFGIPAKTKLLDMPELFGRDAARWIEIGFGNGDNLLALARQQPDMDFLGIEVHRPGVGRLLNALSTEGLTNIRVACDDAFDFLRDRVPNTSVNRVQLLFSDPWPKKRHHKRRIVQPQFVSHIARILVSGGIFQLACDFLREKRCTRRTLGVAHHDDPVPVDVVHRGVGRWAEPPEPTTLGVGVTEIGQGRVEARHDGLAWLDGDPIRPVLASQDLEPGILVASFGRIGRVAQVCDRRLGVGGQPERSVAGAGGNLQQEVVNSAYGL